MSGLFHGLSGRLLVFAGLLVVIVIAVLFVPTWLEQITGVGVVQEPGEPGFNLPTPTDDPSSYTATIPPSATPTISMIGEPALGTVGNCSAAMDYWASHPDSWNFESINIADLAYSAEDITTILAGDPQDVRIRLLQQMLVYSMNVMRGADPGAVIDISNLARAWLSEHAGDEEISEGERDDGLMLAIRLEDFNSGLLGPGLCPSVTDTPLPPATSTSLPASSPTSTATTTLTSTPTRTAESAILTSVAAPGESRPKPDKPQPPPATVQPTKSPPTEPPPEPTEPPPEPTQPPPEPPTPVPTREEPPTPAPTPEP